jgi:hypothetical protein
MSISVTPAQMSSLESTLLNTSGKTPLHERFRALFMLKAVNNDEVVKIVAEGMSPLQHFPLIISELISRSQRPLTIAQT